MEVTCWVTVRRYLLTLALDKTTHSDLSHKGIEACGPVNLLTIAESELTATQHEYIYATTTPKFKPHSHKGVVTRKVLLIQPR
jgi:hypothetical protein